MAEETPNATDNAPSGTPSPAAEPSESEAATDNIISGDTPDVIKENIVSTSTAAASSLPSANKPDQDLTGAEGGEGESDANVKSAGIEKTTDSTAETPAKAKPAAKADAGEAKPAKAKKEKAPAVEDKPFAEFITQDYLPSLQKSLANQGVKDLDLKFEKRVLPIKGMEESDCWQVIGHWSGKQFIVGFTGEDINSPKVFCCADYGAEPSTLESFMIDERKSNLDLLLLYTVQRLNGEKWLARN